VTDVEASAGPIRQLAGFAQVHLVPGDSARLTFPAPRVLSIITDDGRRVMEPGEFVVTVGGRQPPGSTRGSQRPIVGATFRAG
jgi:beta-glucosidase